LRDDAGREAGVVAWGRSLPANAVTDEQIALIAMNIEGGFKFCVTRGQRDPSLTDRQD
jgi:hypothetical protein